MKKDAVFSGDSGAVSEKMKKDTMCTGTSGFVQKHGF